MIDEFKRVKIEEIIKLKEDLKDFLKVERSFYLRDVIKYLEWVKGYKIHADKGWGLIAIFNWIELLLDNDKIGVNLIKARAKNSIGINPEEYIHIKNFDKVKNFYDVVPKKIKLEM